MRDFLILPLFICLTATLISQDYSKKLNDLDHYIEQARQQWETPGLAVAIVKNGQPIWCKGYGVREVNDQAPVDNKTLFGICSTTKAMTAACMAMLVDEDKVRWDDRVHDLFPEFELSDPYMTREIRVRDLFTHNTGLGNADFLWYLWDYEPDVLIAKMRDQQASYPIRGGYTYQNNMYAVAGKLIEKISGHSWQNFIQTRIFDVLGMTNTFPTQEQSKSYLNRSKPHSKYQGKITAFPDESADKIAPAGAVWSTIEDMQKWMLFVLDSAVIDGERLISKKNYEEWLKPQTIVSDAGFYPTQRLTKPHWKTYALGWFQHDYKGRAVSFHTGSLQGTIAIIGLIPDEKLGVYVLGNLDHAEVRHAIMYKVFDLFSDEASDRDWSSELLALYESLKPAKDTSAPESSAQVLPSYPIKDFAGKYENPYLGLIEVDLENDDLIISIGPRDKAKLIHRSRNSFTTEFRTRPYMSESTLVFEDNGKQITGIRYFAHTFKKR